MRPILDFEVNRWHWALRLSFDYLSGDSDHEFSITVAIGPWVGSIGLRWYR